MERPRIGVFGSAEGNTDEILGKAGELGRVLGRSNLIVMTGATNGLPYMVASEAYGNGAEIWEYPPSIDEAGVMADTPDTDLSIYKQVIYVPQDYEFASDVSMLRKYRNITTTGLCDAGIIISGRWGTLNEVTNLYDFGKVIGVLTETGGVADLLPDLASKINKPSKAKFIFNSDPQALVDKVLEELKTRS